MARSPAHSGTPPPCPGRKRECPSEAEFLLHCLNGPSGIAQRGSRCKVERRHDRRELSLVAGGEGALVVCIRTKVERGTGGPLETAAAALAVSAPELGVVLLGPTYTSFIASGAVAKFGRTSSTPWYWFNSAPVPARPRLQWSIETGCGSPDL
jgi:hypothetical protein